MKAKNLWVFGRDEEDLARGAARRQLAVRGDEDPAMDRSNAMLRITIIYIFNRPFEKKISPSLGTKIWLRIWRPPDRRQNP